MFMKKFFFLMASSLMIFVSCERNYYDYYYDCDGCNNVPSNTVALSTFYIDVLPEKWEKFDEAEKYVFASFDAPEITENVVENGLVVAYFVDGDYNNQLPYVFPVVTATSDTIYENMRFDYKKGEISFIVEDSDMKFAIPSNDRTFKVCVFSPN